MTLEYIKNYLRVDSEDEDELIKNLMEVSQIYIDSCVGEAYKGHEKGIKLSELLQIKLINDMYESRGSNHEGANNIKRDIIVTSILESLSMYEEVNNNE
ncbi:head-tail connector protein [Clostridium botulinum]|uniref:head-tail connector protein n=1 Tax=Clostridium TaxID=1485 RepID=UPI0013FEFAA0|nr:head-tail connector protein [Clostridium botulinum]MBY6915480.1 phage head-tail connector protein [Clostridium botulinum]NFQ38302.1 phage gp6-like head-tail connector protein [Clostridium botulinum]